MTRDEILRVDDLKVHFHPPARLHRRRHAPIHAVDGISFGLSAGESLGLVGESGCGKTTTARAIVGLVRPTSGRVRFCGRDIAGLRRSQARPMRQTMHLVFQDPYASLDPRMRVADIVAEPLRIHGDRDAERIRRRVTELLGWVGLEPASASRFPHEFSGGQRQRIGIARALALDPLLLILDEPVSSLDVSVQAQILNLLRDLRRRLELAYLFISHDMSVVRYVCERVAVMHRGTIVETGTCDEIYHRPAHPYTRALLSAVPRIGPDRRRGAGDRSGD